MEYRVLDPNGIAYTGHEGGEVRTFIKGEKIVDRDIQLGHVTEGGLAALEAAGRIERLDAPLQNKMMPSLEKKTNEEGVTEPQAQTNAVTEDESNPEQQEQTETNEEDVIDEK